MPMQRDKNLFEWLGALLGAHPNKGGRFGEERKGESDYFLFRKSRKPDSEA